MEATIRARVLSPQYEVGFKSLKSHFTCVVAGTSEKICGQRVPTAIIKAYTAAGVMRPMGKMRTCPCGFTVISPEEGEVVKHIRLHLSDCHPGSRQTDDEILKGMVSV
jgi:predicted small metal-binding protein